MLLIRNNLPYIFAVTLIVMSNCKPEAIESWELSYRRIDYFLGNIDIKIGTDSCYYLNQGSIYKNPPEIKWKSSKKKLNKLYRQVEEFKLGQCTPLMPIVTEMPIESLELKKNNKVLFTLQKNQQPDINQRKFEDVVAILKSFAASENNGGKY